MTGFQGIGRAIYDLTGASSEIGKELVGKTVQRLLMEASGHSLFFQTSESEGVEFNVEGDCCSQSYFHEIEGIEHLLGGTVRVVEEIALPESVEKELDEKYNPECKESIAYYGLRFITDKGSADVIFRNESNGYYGGWCNAGYVTDCPKGVSIEIKNNGDLYKENEVIGG